MLLAIGVVVSLVLTYVCLCAYQMFQLGVGSFVGNPVETPPTGLRRYVICIGYTFALFLKGHFWVPFVQTPF